MPRLRASVLAKLDLPSIQRAPSVNRNFDDHSPTSTKWYWVVNVSSLRRDGCVPLALPVLPVTLLLPNPALAEPVAHGKSVRPQT